MQGPNALFPAAAAPSTSTQALNNRLVWHKDCLPKHQQSCAAVSVAAACCISLLALLGHNKAETVAIDVDLVENTCCIAMSTSTKLNCTFIRYLV